MSKFHQDRIKRHGAMLWRESQTDRHTDTTKIVVTAGAREPTNNIPAPQGVFSLLGQMLCCVYKSLSWRFVGHPYRKFKKKKYEPQISMITFLNSRCDWFLTLTAFLHV